MGNQVVQIYRQSEEKLKKTRVEHIIISEILPVMRGSRPTYVNCMRMAINDLVQQMYEGVVFIDLWRYFVGKEEIYMTDGLHLSRKGAAVFSDNLLRSIAN